ncbi:hypothetical protein [Lentzea sp. E54]|uniref:hypothetical protein n=1 Tax=Lentzea xerophila TaxID=3435883 RepID=UPI003DA440A4
MVTLTITDPKPGRNMIDLGITAHDGRPSEVDTAAAELVMPHMGRSLPPVTAAWTAPAVDMTASVAATSARSRSRGLR